jgi:hypothetical protein
MIAPETGHAGVSFSLHPARTRQGQAIRRCDRVQSKILLIAAAVFLSPLVFAQGTPKVIGVTPSSGKVSDSVTITGEGLGKGSVAAVFLSDDKSDYKAAILDQAAEKIVMKVPEVKPGGYNVSIQVGNGILIEPVRFTVQE